MKIRDEKRRKGIKEQRKKRWQAERETDRRNFTLGGKAKLSSCRESMHTSET